MVRPLLCHPGPLLEGCVFTETFVIVTTFPSNIRNRCRIFPELLYDCETELRVIKQQNAIIIQTS